MRVYSPHASTALGLLLALGLAACSQGADVDTGAPVNFSSGGPGGAAATTDPATTDDTSSTTDDDSTTADTTATTDTTTTSSTTDDLTSTTDDLTGTTAAPGCDPPVVGNYYDCTPEVGKVDNKLCMWIGSGQSVGYVSCLNASDSVTCTIIDCVDDCDCFDQPPTGTAISTCRPDTTAEGESACVLDCSAGKVCPDGMVCSDDICFWPP